ncbi:hypothetical protein FV139_20570 [Parahaliea maris]|uniref:DUF4145 domain-containing protein n=1 Tax=Parahaliea maris TaxID=2716870 RepID=A0A5C8ZLN1_9GAMM|nr:hypothetical protein [Parahaliea maris]TXS89075.1 hypothetical protein FV139_20570 [Parahaliea maris]
MQKTPEENSILFKFRNSQELYLPDIWDKVFAHNSIIHDVEIIVEEKIKKGEHIVLKYVVQLLSHTQSPSLYELKRDEILSSMWELVDLYRSRYPDPEIEVRLLEDLYKYSNTDGEPRRVHIAEAVRDVGSLEALPTLEAILFDNATTVQTKKAISDAVDAATPGSIEAFLATAEFGARKEFVQLIADAIVEVKNRGESPPKNPVSGNKSQDQSIEHLPEIRNAAMELDRARNYLAQSDNVTAIASMRRGAEALGKHLYRTVGLEERGKPANKMLLNDLMKPVKDSNVPDVFKLCLESLQLFGNFSSHDQDGGHDHLNARITEAIIILYEESLGMYQNWIRTGNPSAKSR